MRLSTAPRPDSGRRPACRSARPAAAVVGKRFGRGAVFGTEALVLISAAQRGQTHGGSLTNAYATAFARDAPRLTAAAKRLQAGAANAVPQLAQASARRALRRTSRTRAWSRRGASALATDLPGATCALRRGRRHGGRLAAAQSAAARRRSRSELIRDGEATPRRRRGARCVAPALRHALPCANQRLPRRSGRSCRRALHVARVLVVALIELKLPRLRLGAPARCRSGRRCAARFAAPISDCAR